jgi:hypothetical protein
LKAEKAQRTIDGDLVEKKMADRVVPYSDKGFRQASIEWLVATDQVRISDELEALVHTESLL